MKFGVTYNCNALQFSGRATYDWIIAQKAKEKGKRVKTFDSNVNHWVLKEEKQPGETDAQQKAKVGLTEPEMKELKTFFKSHEAGRTIPKLSLLKTNVLQNNFKTADPNEFARLQYASKEDLQEAMDLALENHQLQMIQHWMEKVRMVIWPKGVKEEEHKACSTNRHFLRGLFYDPATGRILQGYAPDMIAHFYEYPWLNPVSQLYARILSRYKGLSQTVDSNFLD